MLANKVPIRFPLPPARLVPPSIVIVKTLRVKPGAIVGIPIKACEVLITPTILAENATSI